MCEDKASVQSQDQKNSIASGLASTTGGGATYFTRETINKVMDFHNFLLGIKQKDNNDNKRRRRRSINDDDNDDDGTVIEKSPTQVMNGFLVVIISNKACFHIELYNEMCVIRHLIQGFSSSIYILQKCDPRALS